MDQLIPTYVLRRYWAGLQQGRFEAVSLFVDMSGFTALTETLLRYRKDGAEILTDALNHVFTPLVNAVYAEGGFIATFAGDAFTALFPLERPNAPARAARAATAIQHFFALNHTLPTRYGTFTLGVKVGMGMGAVRWGIVGHTSQRTFFFRGPAIDACAAAEHHTAPGQVVASAELAVLLDPLGCAAAHEPFIVMRDLADGPLPAFRVLRSIRARRFARFPRVTTAATQAFGIEAVLGLAVPAEFRDIACCFLSFDDHSLAQMHTLAQRTLDLATSYGGYVNKIDFGDKGGIIVVLFGAPIAYENNLARAADFLLALQQAPDRHLAKWRAGVTTGLVYAGYIGAARRGEYTAIGDVVNLAARLMAAAPWGVVWLGPVAAEVLRARGYQIEEAGRRTFKGKQAPVIVNVLVGRPATSLATAWYSGKLIGRDGELSQLIAASQPIMQGRCAGVVMVYGEAGVGKSRLVYELRQRMRRSSTVVAWLVCPTDEILRQSLNPFRNWLQKYFDQSPDRTAGTNRVRFDTILDGLIADLPVYAAALREELGRTRSFLAALIDLRWPGSLYEQVEPKLRFENTLAALKTLILAESLRQPVMVYIEDGHLLDADSHAMLELLMRNAADYPFSTLITGRYRDDGSRITLGLDSEVPQTILDLNVLSDAGIRALAAQLLGAEIGPNLATFLLEKTGGNPFFTEQLLLDLRERGLVVSQTLPNSTSMGFELADQRLVAEVPASVSAVLVARLDRLPGPVKAVVQMAAVLGQEFEFRVLAAMLQNDVEVTDRVLQATNEAIWLAQSELYYIFRHALLRDAAYDMQMSARLRERHHLAADAIVDIYRDDISAHAADLTYHYGRAGDHQLERQYARLAGEAAVARYSNREALVALSRALELTPATDLDERYELVRLREQVEDLLGMRNDQQRDVLQLAELAAQLGNPRYRSEAALRRASYAEATSDYPAAIAAAQAAVTLAREAAHPSSEALGYLAWARAVMSQADYPLAHTYLEQALELAHTAGNTALEADVLINLGGVHFYQSDFATARQTYAQALERFHAADDRRGESRALNNLGVIAYEQADYAAAQTYQQQALDLCRMTGNRRGESSALNNLGNAAWGHGDYSAARGYYEQATRLYHEIADRQGESRTRTNLGILATEQGDYTAARTFLSDALKLYREIGDRQGESLALSNLGSVAFSQGDYPAAHDYQQRALELHRAVGNRRGEAETMSNLALLYHQRGEDITAQAYAEAAIELASSLGVRSEVARALTHLGHALRGQKRFDEAIIAYTQALELRQALGEHHLALEIYSGLARVALLKGDVALACVQIAPILERIGSNLATNGGKLALDETNDPFRIALTTYQVLAATNDPRAFPVLRAAYTRLAERAALITDGALRQTFLEQVPAHRELCAVWGAQIEN